MLIIETGAIVAGANSCISTTDFITYATARSYTVVSGAETLLVQAMDYLEALQYKGYKKTEAQPLQWPRTDVYIDGYYFASDDIPQQLINAQCEIAMAIDAGNGPLADIARQTVSETVGPISVTYSDGSAPFIINKKISNALWKLLGSGSQGNILQVNKG